MCLLHLTKARLTKKGSTNNRTTPEKGDFVTIIGSNGAGKSTLMNVISGALLPDEGDVQIDGQTVIKHQEYKRSALIGRVFQDPMAGTAPTMTIEENLAIAYSRNRKRSLKPGVNKQRKSFLKSRLKPFTLDLKIVCRQKSVCYQVGKDKHCLF